MNAFSDKSLVLGSAKLLTGEPGPKYARVRSSLRRLIRTQGVEPGTFLPSERDLAMKFGVSNITIKRALSDLAAEGIIERKQGVGTFVANIALSSSQLAGKGAAGPQSAHESVLFLSCGQSPGTYIELLGGVERLMASHDRAVLYSGLQDYNDLEAMRLKRLIKRNSVCMILITGFVDNKVVHFAKCLGPPVILIGNYPVTEAISHVYSDVHGGTQGAVEILVSSGCKRIGLLNGRRRYGAGVQLADSFAEAVCEHADQIEHSEVFWLDGPDPHRHALDFIEKFGRTGGVVVEGGMTQELLHATAEKGVRLPDELKVIAYEGLASYQGGKRVSQYCAPWLDELPVAVFKIWQTLQEQPNNTIKVCLPLKFVRGDST